MAYSKQNFQDGQILTAANLEKMENGIIAGQGAKNLLVNSDFRNPVNQRGATTATLGKYFIDRWGTEPFPSGPSITIDSNGLTLLPTTSSTAGIYQMLPDYENRKGKVHTFAICVDNVWKCVSFAMGNFGVGYFIHGLAFFSVDNRNILIRNNASDTPVPITIQRVALYEGSYTADTLPSYVPKDKHVEMLNCNVPLAPHNLLDNSDFRNPVNQRGIESGTTVSAWKYHIDRWNNYHDADGTISFNTNGIVINMHMGQVLNPDSVKTGTVVTAAVKWNDGTIQIARGTITRGNAWTWFYSGTQNGSLVGVIDNGDNRTSIFVVQSDGRKTLVWAALYEGAYDASTLPPYQPKGYAAELAECKRYYQTRDISNYKVVVLGEELYFAIEHSDMRIAPSITIINPIANENNSIANLASGGKFATEIRTITKDRSLIYVATGTSGKSYAVSYTASADL